MQTKSILQSTTFWIAIAQAVAGVLVVFSTTYPSVGWLVIGKSIIDVILRISTTQPITLTA